MGSRRVRHDWSDLAAAAAAVGDGVMGWLVSSPPDSSSDEVLTSSTTECVLIWKYMHVCVCVCVCVCLPTHMCALSHFSSVRLLATLWMVAHQASLSVGLYRQEYWRGLPCVSPGGLPVLGIEPMSPVAHALQADSLESAQADSEPPGKPKIGYKAIAHVIS